MRGEKDTTEPGSASGKRKSNLGVISEEREHTACLSGFPYGMLYCNE